MEAQRARLAQRGSMHSTTARPAIGGVPKQLKYLRAGQAMWFGVPTHPASSNRLKRLQHKGSRMPTAQTTTPQQACENILIDDKRYNTERGILRSENAIIDRLLTRGLEQKSAYGELYEKLRSRPRHSGCCWAFS